MLSSTKNRIKQHLLALYNEQTADQSLIKILTLINDFQNKYPEQQTQSAPLTADDVVLITYGDQFSETPHKPLHTLDQFLKNIVLGTINTVHILPFFPYTSDDGFSVVDYTMIDPALGDWGDIARLKQNFSLMFDFVLNHISRDSEWFQEYLRGNPNYDKFFITVPSTTDLSQVVRPRALPLLTPVETQDGVKRVWTTFSEDQIDLNFANPEVLLRMISILLFYVSKGADLIRLDAIAYLWKEVGTSCIHLPQTHHVVKLFRAVLDAAAPNVRLITETNVPHQENISYFGSALVNEQDLIVGGDEAQLVYQFPLAPLLLHTLRVEDTHLLNQWLQTLQLPFPGVTFFNFLASHDGIGIRPAEQILTESQIQALVKQTEDHGGQVSYKHNADGTRAPYELNITLYDMVNGPASRDTPTGIDRFIASQAVMLSLAGVPGIYIHSLFGSSNCVDCVQETGRARSINRQKFDFSQIMSQLADPKSRAALIYNRTKHLLQVRRNLPAFAPLASQRVIARHPNLLILLRGALENPVLVVINLSSIPVSLELSLTEAGLPESKIWVDQITQNKYFMPPSHVNLNLTPYQVLWLTPKS